MARTVIKKVIATLFLLLDAVFMFSVFLAFIRNLITSIVGLQYLSSRTTYFAFIGLIIDTLLLGLGYIVGVKLWREIKE
jgi:hypothetical protein